MAAKYCWAAAGWLRMAHDGPLAGPGCCLPAAGAACAGASCAAGAALPYLDARLATGDSTGLHAASTGP
jgi:hypothetical protein